MVEAETQIVEREKAEVKYDDAVAEGNQAVMVAKRIRIKRRSMVVLNIGAFPPRTKVVLTCFMHKQLPLEDEGYAFTFPFTYVPEYLFDQSKS